MINLREKILKGLSVVCTATVILSVPITSMAANKTIYIAKLGDYSNYTKVRDTRSRKHDYVKAMCHAVWSNQHPEFTKDFKRIRVRIKRHSDGTEMSREVTLVEGNSMSNIEIVSNMRGVKDIDFVFYGNSSKYPAHANVGYNPM